MSVLLAPPSNTTVTFPASSLSVNDTVPALFETPLAYGTADAGDGLKIARMASRQTVLAG